MKKTRERLIFATLFCSVAITGCCTESVESLTVFRLINKLGEVPMSDSVRISFKVNNRSTDTITVRLIPECDCTTVSAEEVVLSPREKVTVYAGVMLNMAGDFQKYIFVEIFGTEEFYSVEIIGTAKIEKYFIR